MRRSFSGPSWLLLSILLSFLVVAPRAAYSQSRLSDKDIDTTLKNIQEDTKQFRDTFNSALKKSTVRKTSQEKDARDMIKTFEQQLDSTRHYFKDKHQVGDHLSALVASRDKIDSFLHSVSLGDQTNSEWGRIKAELDTLAKSFNIGS